MFALKRHNNIIYAHCQRSCLGWWVGGELVHTIVYKIILHYTEDEYSVINRRNAFTRNDNNS